MAQIIEGMESILTYIVEIGIVLLELFGVCVLLFTAVKSFLLWLKKEESVRLDLAQGIALALEFKMGGEEPFSRGSGQSLSFSARSFSFAAF